MVFKILYGSKHIFLLAEFVNEISLHVQQKWFQKQHQEKLTQNQNYP